MRKKETSDWGRRTGRTAEQKRQAFFEALSDEKKAESFLYVKDGRLVGDNTLETIPKEFMKLLKFKFPCPHCKDYHSHAAGAAFCEKNPDREKAVQNARLKAAKHYYDKGRKHEIRHGNNVKRSKITAGIKAYHANMSEEKREKQRKILSEANKGKKLTQKQLDNIVAAAKARSISPERVEMAAQKANVVRPTFFDHSISEIREEFNRDEFSSSDSFGRSYNIDGDFDPFS